MERVEEYAVYGARTPHVEIAADHCGVIVKLATNPGISLDQLQEGIDIINEKLYLMNQPQKLDLFEIVDIKEVTPDEKL